jgi:hypothetical protein
MVRKKRVRLNEFIQSRRRGLGVDEGGGEDKLINLAGHSRSSGRIEGSSIVMRRGIS